MTADDLLEAARHHDWEMPGRACAAPPSFLGVAERELPSLDDVAQHIVALALVRQDAPGAGRALLRIAATGPTAAAAVAAQGLATVADPPPSADVIATIPRVADPLVRTFLYLSAGRLGSFADVPALRDVAALEEDSDVLATAQVAAVRLGAVEERDLFVQQLHETTPAGAKIAAQYLMYVNDPGLAVGLLGWLNDGSAVMRMCTDPKRRSARMCDLAVWTARSLGVPLGRPVEALDIYPADVIDDARRALTTLASRAAR